MEAMTTDAAGAGIIARDEIVRELARILATHQVQTRCVFRGEPPVYEWPLSQNEVIKLRALLVICGALKVTGDDDGLEAVPRA